MTSGKPTPIISVILPVRNGGAYLAEAVDSILMQSFSSLELLLVDDYSDDDAVVGLDARDERLRILKNPRQGISGAFNHGLQQASGQFVARMDADDLAMPGRFEAQLRYLEKHPEVDICGGCVEFFSQKPLAGGILRYQRWLNQCLTPLQIQQEIYIECPIPNPTGFFRRDAIMQLGGYSDPDWPEDYDLYLRANAAGMQMGKPDEIVLKWREHARRVTHTDSRYQIGRFQAAKAHYLVQSRLGGRPVVIWGAGPTGRDLHDFLENEGADIRGFLEVHPRRIGGSKRNLPVWPIDHVNELHDEIVLVAVGAAGARTRISQWMTEQGKEQGTDYLFVA